MNAQLDSFLSKANPKSLQQIESLILEAEQQESVSVGSYEVRIWTADEFDSLAGKYGELLANALLKTGPEGEVVFNPSLEGIVLALMAIPGAIAEILDISFTSLKSDLRNNLRVALLAAALRVNLVDNAGVRCFFGDGPSSGTNGSPDNNSSSPSDSAQGTASE